MNISPNGLNEQHIKETFAQRLKARRKECGYKTHAAIAEALGGSPTAQSIFRYENAERMPDGVALVQIAHLLNCTVDYLLGLEDAPTHEAASIVEQTGLSAKSIHRLLWLNSMKYESDCLSSITHGMIDRILSLDTPIAMLNVGKAFGSLMGIARETKQSRFDVQKANEEFRRAMQLLVSDEMDENKKEIYCCAEKAFLDTEQQTKQHCALFAGARSSLLQKIEYLIDQLIGTADKEESYGKH